MMSHTPRLVVSREINRNDGTTLHEFWALDQCYWGLVEDEGDGLDNPTLRVYIAPFTGTNDIGSGGLPHSSDRASDACMWDEAPKEVRDALKEEAGKIQNAVSGFGE